MDGPPWRWMPAGLWWRHLLPRLRICFKVVLPTPVATTLPISRAVDNHLATKYSKWSAYPGRSLPVLYWYPSPISPTEPVSIAQLVRRSVGHTPSHISSRPQQAPTRIRTRSYNFLEKVRVKNSTVLDHSAKLPPYWAIINKNIIHFNFD